ncbi:MAG: UDP-galactopyranose mutase [Polaromonas sp.]|nr:UDP-galactopyranose mutase [Polaromonas sp.]
MRIAIIGAGWAGCAAAVEATRRGHHITLFEAARTLGGRARRVDVPLNGMSLALDNGQHILIGAYSETLALMKQLGVDIDASLLRMPLTLQSPEGTGLALPMWPAPFDALAGILRARGWSWADKLSLLRVAIGWQLGGFTCEPRQSVADVCSRLSPQIMASFIEPLCVSALNIPAAQASGQVFLRVLRDAMFSGTGGSNLLLPRVDLFALMPEAASAWLRDKGAEVRLGARVHAITTQGRQWLVNAGTPEPFEAILLACPALEAARLARGCGLPCESWVAQTLALQYEAITTVYAVATGARLAQPMLALPSSATQPAQFVFDRGQLGGPTGLLAFVISASHGDAAELGGQVVRQAKSQLGLADLQVLQTIVEKRATFACTPALQRPGMRVTDAKGPALLACGDYVAGPYPATLEGAVRSGLDAAHALSAAE